MMNRERKEEEGKRGTEREEEKRRVPHINSAHKSYTSTVHLSLQF